MVLDTYSTRLFWRRDFAVKAWIQVIDEEHARDELRAVYESVKNARGSVSNVMRVQSLDPESIRLHLDLYLHLMFGKSTVTRLEREMIAVAVSQSNQCSYCVTHHSEALSAHAKDPRILEGVREPLGENLSPRNKAMLDYAIKLTKNPAAVSKEDLDALRTAGFADEEILRINLIVSYFNFANRVVSGLGVPLEDREARSYRY